MKKLSLVVLCLVLASAVMVGQLKKGAIGVTGGTSSSSTLGLAYGMSENLRLGVDLLFSSLSEKEATPPGATPAGDNETSTSSLGVGVSAKFYLGTSDNLSTYVGGMISFGSGSMEYTPVGGTTTKVSGSAFGVGAMYGAEYWFSPKFSWYGHVGLGYDSGSSDGPPKTSSSLISTSFGTGLTWWM